METKSSEHEIIGVLPNTFANGPKGLGDPNDRSLRKVESVVIIPRLMQDMARLINCAQQAKEFNECGKEWGLNSIFKCRQHNKQLVECLKSCYENEEFKKQATEMYLQKRKIYRETGIKEKLKPMRH